MRVLIDGYNLQLEQGTGVATYGRSLSHLLGEAGHEIDVLYGRPVSRRGNALVREVEFFDRIPAGRLNKVLARAVAMKRMLKPGTLRPQYIPDTPVVIKHTLRQRMPRYDRLWNGTGLYDRALARYQTFGRVTRVSNREIKADVVHWTFPVPVRVPGVPNVYTIHDLVPIRLPYTTQDRKAKFVNLLQSIAKRAELIVTVSETSRRDIVEVLGVDESRVVNTYQPVTIPEEMLEGPEDELGEKLRGLFGMEPEGYILACGAVEPKKNFGRLIEAYLSTDLSLPLVLAGPDGWLSEIETRLLHDERNRIRVIDGQRQRVHPRVVRLGYVKSSELIALIRGARCLAMPSLYEGFGLPIVEAMTCGTAVLTSDRGATAEIAGDAAELVDPYDVESIARGLRELCTNADRRAELIERGHTQRKRFSPEACGQRLAEAYGKLGLS